MSSFTPQQLNELRQLILTTSTDAQKGRYAGYGNPQVDTYNYPDNCTASFPWNFDFVIPKNFQRWTSVHLSFKLRAYRTYDQTAAAAPHIHYWSMPSQTDAPVYYFSLNSTGNTSSQGVRQSGGGGTPTAGGKGTSTEHAVAGATASTNTSVEAFDNQGHTHQQVLGITESTAPTSVSISIDGTDYTSTLGGPWTADTVELDITKVMPTATGQFHAISLTPNQNGRITGELRFSYFVDASVNA